MLVNATEMLIKARDGHYGVPQFNINNLEWTKSVLTACEEMKSPVILGVSEGAGKYMTGFKTVAAMVSAMVDSMGITVPVALHLDHGTYEGCKACIEAGFSSIMFDGSHYSIEENVEKTKELVALAHAKGLSIEAEVGSIGGVEDGVVGAGEIADPEECAKITALGIDFLAAGIGNIHGVYPANWKGLDFEALDRIHKATNNIPLVLHGGTRPVPRQFPRFPFRIRPTSYRRNQAIRTVKSMPLPSFSLFLVSILLPIGNICCKKNTHSFPGRGPVIP